MFEKDAGAGANFEYGLLARKLVDYRTNGLHIGERRIVGFLRAVVIGGVVCLRKLVVTGWFIDIDEIAGWAQHQPVTHELRLLARGEAEGRELGAIDILVDKQRRFVGTGSAD